MSAPSQTELRLARDLHDGIAQDLVALGYQLDLTLAHQPDNMALRGDIRRARFEVDALINKVRQQILELRKPPESNFAKALETALREKAADHNLRLSIDDLQIESELQLAITDIALELLRNAVNHARASQIEIALYSINNRICLEVSDDGIGGAQVKEGHFGISGVCERVRDLGGQISIRSKESLLKGTAFTILL